MLAAVAKTGYQPNRAARHLRTRKSLQLAFNLTSSQVDVRNPFTLILLRSLVSRAADLGYRVTVLTQPDQTPQTFRTDVSHADVDGVIISDCTYGDYRTAILSELSVPFAVLGRTSPGEPQAWVDLDNRSAMHAVVDHLVTRGHTSFGYLGYQPIAGHWSTERLQGVRERLAEHNLSLPERSVLRVELDGLHAGVTGYLDRETRPTAIICESDSIAVHVVNIAHRLRLGIGTDLAVTGFDGVTLQRTVDPLLTTVQIPIDELATMLVRRLFREMEDRRNGEPGLMVTAGLAIGGTT